MKRILSIAILLSVSFFVNAQSTDAQGRKQGYWKKVDEKSQKLIYEGMFKDDKPQGIFKYYYPFDTVKAIIDFKQDGKFAYAKLYHPTGKLMAKGKYVGESIKDSLWTYYDDLGVLMSNEMYIKGKKEGKALVFFPNGKLAEEKNFKGDKQHGVFKQYYDGVKVKAEGNFIDGKQEGKASFYYPNGVSAATGFYKNGLRSGPWIYKDKDGKINNKELYEYGQIMDKKKTDEFFSKNKVKEENTKKQEKKPAGTKTAPKKS